LDLLIVTPETKKAWDERLVVGWEGSALKVVSPQGLILLNRCEAVVKAKTILNILGRDKYE